MVCGIAVVNLRFVKKNTPLVTNLRNFLFTTQNESSWLRQFWLYLNFTLNFTYLFKNMDIRNQIDCDQYTRVISVSFYKAYRVCLATLLSLII